MGRILGNWRMLGAVLFAVVVIGGAFVLAGSAARPPSAQASEESALLSAIASRDSDSDGLADWEEALYGTDPKNADTRDLGMTDGEAVAAGLIVPRAIAEVPGTDAGGTLVNPDLPSVPAEGTLTAAFAKNVFTLYLDSLQKSGGDLSEGDLASIADQALTELGDSIKAAPPFKSAHDLEVSGSGTGAMKTYAAAVEKVMLANTSDASKSELAYLKDAVENNDATALAHISSLAKAYRMSAAGIAVLPVPTELAAADLALINSLARTSEATNDFAALDEDPLTTVLALKQYPGDILALVDALQSIATTFKAAGITLAPGEPGASIVNLVSDVAAEQAAAKKP